MPLPAGVLVTGLTAPIAAMAVDDANVYWLTQGLSTGPARNPGPIVDGQVMKCAIAGCDNHPTVLASGLSLLPIQGLIPSSLALVGTELYWVGQEMTQGGVIYSCGTSGCNCSPSLIASGLNDPVGLAVAGGRAFWTEYDDGLVESCASMGCDGGPSLLASMQLGPEGMVADAVSLYWTGYTGRLLRCALPDCAGGSSEIWHAQTGTLEAQTMGVAVDATNLYWTNNVQQVLTMPFSETTATVLTTLVAPGDFLGGSQPISVDPTGVYVPANPGAGVDAVLSVPLTGGAAGTVATFASAFNGVPGIVSDGKNVYWANNFGFAVMRAPVTGGTAVTISCDVEKPEGIAQDATHVYWTTEGGSVKALSK